jgi:hypothetical protein
MLNSISSTRIQDLRVNSDCSGRQESHFCYLFYKSDLNDWVSFGFLGALLQRVYVSLASFRMVTARLLTPANTLVQV